MRKNHLLFSSASEEKGLVSATFFTERERPAGTAMYEKAFLLPQTGTVMMQLQVLRLFFWTAFQRCGMITIAEKRGCLLDLLLTLLICTRSLMDRTEASDAFNAGSIPVECIRRRGGSPLRRFLVHF